ncbi:MAG: SAM-dependent methyltransferase [Desulfuromonadales bacterium]
MQNEQPSTEKPQLVELLRQRIEAEGGIPFADYMSACLYHPEYGYYTGARERIGKGGDFFTSSSVHALFGRLIARQLVQMWELLGRGPFTIAEQGAGEGHLALDVLDALVEESPQMYEQLDYRMVEVSPDNRDRQKSRLAKHATSGRIFWCREEELNGLRGCVLSNELVDAFPVHLVEMTADGLREVFVVNTEDGFAEELRPLSDPAIAEHLATLGVKLAPGYCTEVNLEAPRWITRVGDAIEKGFVLTIDYGYPAVELYAPHRNAGTLMCFHRHTSNDNPYKHVGCQDITAHIDFTSLERAGRTAGLETLYFGEQYRFLMALGFVDALVELQARETDPQKAQALRMTLKNLILPDGGMGDTFKVLVQGKGVGTPQLLCQRRISDIPLPV